MYELVIVWDTGSKDKDIYTYETEEEAEIGAERMKMAFGKQIVWAGVRKVETTNEGSN